MELTTSLADALADDALGLHNGSAKSNSIAAQFWCVVGARESYARAIQQGQWQGFACSLSQDDMRSAARIHQALVDSHRTVEAAVAEVESQLDSQRTGESQLDLALALLEHESQHHGQLIRYFYANDLDFPAAFAKRYALG